MLSKLRPALFSSSCLVQRWSPRLHSCSSVAPIKQRIFGFKTPKFRTFHSSRKLLRETDVGVPLKELLEAKPRPGARLALLAKILGASAGVLVVVCNNFLHFSNQGVCSCFNGISYCRPIYASLRCLGIHSYRIMTYVKRALISNYEYENENSYHRKKDIAQFLKIFEGQPTDVIILTGSNRGKTVLSKELAGFDQISLT